MLINKKMKLYYCDINNFGDLLNTYIFKEIFGIETTFAPLENCDAIGIGSILDHQFLQIKHLFRFIKNKRLPVYALSSGFARDIDYYKKRVRYLYNPILKRKIIPISLRGKLSKSFLEKITKKTYPECALGDLGLLSSYLIKNKPEKKYSLGICPHYADKNNPIFDEILKNNPNSIILDTQSDPIDYILKIAQCDAIISTGLHPLICADSLGVPNLWCRVSDKTTTIFKYRDYYSVFGINPEPFYLINNKICTDDVIKNYQIRTEQVDAIKTDLINAHKQFFDEFYCK